MAWHLPSVALVLIVIALLDATKVSHSATIKSTDADININNNNEINPSKELTMILGVVRPLGQTEEAKGIGGAMETMIANAPKTALAHAAPTAQDLFTKTFNKNISIDGPTAAHAAMMAIEGLKQASAKEKGEASDGVNIRVSSTMVASFILLLFS